ncbi:hypothetical protein JZ751_019292 [Albula glossodonta]|uniref:G-protein coupled receptors family 1 profile domain-containing protein n=1 Tax=Albula glossodonta TaxID=121402 RepID=A0A8T2NQV2_9TELE|nr:hypothetical protein JZ751_019292 [Albula glossodonta]
MLRIMDKITETAIIEALFSGDYYDYNVTNSPITEGGFLASECTGDLRFLQQVFQPLVYSVLLVAGLAGNGLLLMVLLRRRGRLRATEAYLLHLAVADLLLLITFPFALGQSLVGWVFGDFLCRALGLLNVLSFLCGSLLLACIGFDRYLAVVWAVRSVRGRRSRAVHLTCTAVWALALCLSAPNAVFLSVTDNRDREHNLDRDQQDGQHFLSCSFTSHGLHGNNWNLARRFITHLCFFVPLGLMGYCYAAVVGALRKSRQRGRDKQGAIRLAMLLTAVFCLWWLPYNLAILVRTLYELGALDKSCVAQDPLNAAIVVTESLGYSHCCINPLLYAFAGTRFRQDLARTLQKWGCRGPACLTALKNETSALRGTSTSEGSHLHPATSTSSSMI